MITNQAEALLGMAQCARGTAPPTPADFRLLARDARKNGQAVQIGLFWIFRSPRWQIRLPTNRHNEGSGHAWQLMRSTLR